ncbi:MAG: hypothetical protein KBA26_02185 [Candidatus Delongbacteria bacterium]|nr:hypothetical protein [Candidatus Delongbacteria bacterium]
MLRKWFGLPFWVGLCLIGLLSLSTAQTPKTIVFSNQPIDVNNPTNLMKKFKAGDYIYAAAFLEKDFLALNKDPNASKIFVEIHYYQWKKPQYDYQSPYEEYIDFNGITLTGSARKNQSIVFGVAPEPDKMIDYNNPEIAYKKFGVHIDGPVKICRDMGEKLEGGTRKIVFRVKVHYEDAAVGEFEIEGGSFGFYSELAEKLKSGSESADLKSAAMPKSQKTDKRLEAEMTAAFKKSNMFNGDFPGGSILRVVIVDADWMIERHPISGAILFRYLRGAFAVKDKSGTCWIVKMVTFKQDYVGGKFQATRFDGMGDKVKIECANVYK